PGAMGWTFPSGSTGSAGAWKSSGIPPTTSTLLTSAWPTITAARRGLWYGARSRAACTASIAYFSNFASFSFGFFPAVAGQGWYDAAIPANSSAKSSSISLPSFFACVAITVAAASACDSASLGFAAFSRASLSRSSRSMVLLFLAPFGLPTGPVSPFPAILDRIFMSAQRAVMYLGCFREYFRGELAPDIPGLFSQLLSSFQQLELPGAVVSLRPSVVFLERFVGVRLADRKPLELGEGPVSDVLIATTERKGALPDPVDHRVRPDLQGRHALEAIQDALPGLALVVADQHVDQQVVRRHAVALKRLYAAEEPLLVPDVVPRGIEAPDLEAVIVVGDGRQRLGRRVVDHPDVDSLVEADFEAARLDLVDPSFPFLTRLAEEVVVEQVDVLRPRSPAPDRSDGVHRARFSLLF